MKWKKVREGWKERGRDMKERRGMAILMMSNARGSFGVCVCELIFDIRNRGTDTTSREGGGEGLCVCIPSGRFTHFHYLHFSRSCPSFMNASIKRPEESTRKMKLSCFLYLSSTDVM